MGASEPEVQQQLIDQQEGLETARAAKASLDDANALLETLKARRAEIDAAVAGLAEITSAANAKLTEINDVGSTAAAAKTSITDTQNVISTKSAHIEDAKTHADKVRAEVDRTQVAVTQQATETEGLRARAQAAMDGITPIVTAITQTKAAAESDLAATNAALAEAKAATNTTKALADKAATVEQRVADYESRLAKLEQDGITKLDTITALLPQATATGLAHAFDARRKTFLPTVTNGERWFVGSVLVLALLAATGLIERHDTLQDLARVWVLRLPIAAVLIWLAMESKRNAALARRLEEDYGFKAATAAQFQGFQKQMAEIGAVAPETPLAKLYADTLAIIAEPPGRIYDKHALTVKPGEEVAAIAGAVAAAVKDALSSAKKEEK